MCKEVYMVLANHVPLVAILKKDHSCCPTLQCGTLHLLLLSVLWETKRLCKAAIGVGSF